MLERPKSMATAGLGQISVQPAFQTQTEGTLTKENQPGLGRHQLFRRRDLERGQSSCHVVHQPSCKTTR